MTVRAIFCTMIITIGILDILSYLIITYLDIGQLRSFALDHPVIAGTSLILISIYGCYLLAKRST